MNGPGLVAFASTEGGCAHYRAELPARLLHERLGWDTAYTVDIEFGIGGGIGVPGLPDPDVIVLAGGWSATPPDLVEAARAVGQTVLVDSDDWPWLPTENPHYTPNGGTNKVATMRAADGVTVSTPYMAHGLAEHFPNQPLTICRNFIDPTWYAKANAVNRARTHHEGGPLKVAYRGFLCGFHDADVRTLRGLLPADDLFEYVHIGADPRGRTFAELARLPHASVEDRPATEYGPAYFDALAGVDLALIPLAPRPFNAAKSNIAALEWLAAGVLPIYLGPRHEEFHGIPCLPRNEPRALPRLLEEYRAAGGTFRREEVDHIWTEIEALRLTRETASLVWANAIFRACGRHEANTPAPPRHHIHAGELLQFLEDATAPE